MQGLSLFFFFLFLVTDFYLGFCCFYQISCVFFLIWLSFFIKFNFKEVISSKFNVWMYWELIKSVWVCYKKVDFDFGVDGVSWDLLFSSWGFMYLKAFNFLSMSVWLCYVCWCILMVDLKVDVFLCALCVKISDWELSYLKLRNLCVSRFQTVGIILSKV